MPQERDNASQPQPGRRDPWRWVLVAALLALTLLLGCFPMGDFDVWWHLRTGQFILEHRTVPRVDIYTYTNAGRPWIDVYWLFQVIIALLHRVGGVPALVGLKALAGVVVVACTLLARRPGAAMGPAVGAWLPGVIVLSGRLCERPELFSLLFLAGFLVVLGRAQERPGRLWLLPGLQLLWVNSHGFFVLGPLMVAAFAADLSYQRWRRRAIPPGLVRNLALAGGAVVVACLINPYGLAAVGLTIEQFHKLGGTGTYRTHIGELKSIGDFIVLAGANNPYLLGFLLLLTLGITSFVGAGLRRRFSVFRGLLFAGAAYLGWQATRNSALFAVVAAQVVMWNLDDVSALKASAAPAPRRRRRAPPAQPKVRPRMQPVLLAALVLAGVAVVSGKLYAWAGEGRTMGLGERRQWCAHESCEFLARPGMPERIVAFNLGQAAVCIAHTGEQRKQFIDPRLEVSSPETFERYLAALRGLWRGGMDWQAALAIDEARPDEIPALLVERGVLTHVIDVLAHNPRWRCVHADPVAAVFVTERFADEHGLAAVVP
jgi:hypothetical protein